MDKFNFSNNLKYLRQKNNLTQLELAKKLDVTKQSISAYENGKSEPNIFILSKLATIFNCSIDSIIFDKNVLDINEFRKINDLLKNHFKSSSAIDILIKNKNDLIDKKSELDIAIKEIDTIILKLKSLNDTEFSEELSFSKINATELGYLNSIDIDFYDNNNVIIFNAPKYYICEKYDTSKIPNIAPISAGYPSFTTNDADRFFNIESDDLDLEPDNYFALRVNGDSMNKLYKDGDHILVEKTSNVKNGTPAIVIIENDYATFKIFSKDDDAVYLTPQSTNPKHKIQTYPLDEYKYRVIGKVLGVINEFE